jgi:hypothetical protein
LLKLCISLLGSEGSTVEPGHDTKDTLPLLEKVCQSQKAVRIYRIVHHVLVVYWERLKLEAEGSYLYPGISA